MINKKGRLYGKKILILGGTEHTVGVIAQAHTLGLYVICVDYFETGAAKKLADEAYVISTNDFESLLRLIKDKRIDGVFTGASEFNVKNMILLCDKAGLPCYCNLTQWNTMQNKRAFKNECKKYGVPVVQEYCHSTDIDAIQFPVVVKPTDSCASRGLSVCRDKSSFTKAVEYANSFSESKTYIIEKLMECNNVVSYYTVVDGQVSLSAIGDWVKFKNKDGIEAVTSTITFPSHLTKQYQEIMTECVENLIHGLGIMNGVFNLQLFEQNGEFFTYECCLRISGTQEYNIISEINGINNLEMLLEYAVTGSMGDQKLLQKEDPYFHGKVACNLAVMIGSGTISRIDGVQEVCKNPYIVNMSTLKAIGSVVSEKDIGTLDQTFARFHIVCDDMLHINSVIDMINDKLRIYDADGIDMKYETKKLFGDHTWKQAQQR